VDLFPTELWARLSARLFRRATPGNLGYGDPAGYPLLREAIAAYLGESRGIRCDPGQVLIVAGSQQGFDIACRVLLDPGDSVWVEEPGYLGTRGALLAAGARIVPVPVDGEGLDVAAGINQQSMARMASVTPAHQYPLGSVMSLPRRLALLEWAGRSGAWIVEDDYDSEFRYSGRPLMTLRGLDQEGRVVYLGTFSKVLLPSLRLGYLVVPPGLVDTFLAARALSDDSPPFLSQAVTAEFMAEGHFARHIRRMRAAYADRRAAMLEGARRDLRGIMELPPDETGLQLVGWLAGGLDELNACREAAESGIDMRPLSAYRLLPSDRPGVLLGYAAFSPRDIRDALRRLGEALRGALRRS
jgi:GntR family transcriptional regulator/MocR family aminotransferase